MEILLTILILVVAQSLPLGRWLLGLEPRIESLSGEGRVAFVLVHGTFAYKAKWTDSNAILTRKLVERYGDDAHILRMLWSGDNHQRVRSEASRALFDWYLAHHDQYDQVTFIAHSHGGGIAVNAARMCERKLDLESGKLQVTTLSTPYIVATDRLSDAAHVAQRETTYRRTTILASLAATNFLCMPLLDCFSKMNDACENVSTVFFMLLLVLPASVLFISLIDMALIGFGQVPSRLVSRDLRLLDHRSALCLESLDHQLTSTKLLIFRSSGDEASLLIGFGQFAARFVHASDALIEEICVLVDRRSFWCFWVTVAILLMWFAFGRAIPFNDEKFWLKLGIMFALVLTFSKVLVSVYPTMFRLMSRYVLAVVGFPCYLFMGLDIALLHRRVSFTAESTPVGKWEIRAYHAATGLGLAHSSLHSNPTFIAELIDTLNPVCRRPV